MRGPEPTPPLRHLTGNSAPRHLQTPPQPRPPSSSQGPPRGDGQGCCGERRAKAPLLKIGCARLRGEGDRPGRAAPDGCGRGPPSWPCRRCGAPRSARPPAGPGPATRYLHHERQAQRVLGDALAALLAGRAAALGVLRPVQLLRRLRHRRRRGATPCPAPAAPRFPPPAGQLAERRAPNPASASRPDLPLGHRFGAPASAWNVPVRCGVSMGGGERRRVTWRRGRAAPGARTGWSPMVPSHTVPRPGAAEAGTGARLSPSPKEPSGDANKAEEKGLQNGDRLLPVPLHHPPPRSELSRSGWSRGRGR